MTRKQPKRATKPKTPKPVEAWAFWCPHSQRFLFGSLSDVQLNAPRGVWVGRVRIVPIVKRTKRKERKK